VQESLSEHEDQSGQDT